MTTLSKALQAAAGNAGAEAVYVEDVFSTYLYTGNSSTQTITNGIDLAGEGGLVWTKRRSSIMSHALVDTERGIVGGYLQTNTTGAKASMSINADLTGFTSSGYSLGTDGSSRFNTTSETYASWTFRKAEKFFDVVTWVGNGATSRTISHNLGSAPGVLILKNCSNGSSWSVFHRSLGVSQTLLLNDTSAAFGASGRFGSSAPTNTTFDINNIYNTNGETYVAYLFAHDAGGFGDDGTENVISCGSVTANASAEVTVNLGWEPQFIIYKPINAVGDWFVVDNMRGWTANTSEQLLRPNSSAAESGGGNTRPLATGFGINPGNSTTYIYIAIRRGPMKTPESGTEVYTAVTRTGTGATTTITGLGFPPDAILYDRRGGLSAVPRINDKMRGAPAYLDTSSTAAEVSATQTISAFEQDGVTLGTAALSSYPNNSGESYINWFFRRAPGFFDVVCYTGNGSGTHNVSHNLGTKPLLVICKSRSTGGTGYNWPAITDTSVSSSATLFLNNSSSNNGGSSSGMFTDTTVNVGSSAGLASLYGSNQVNASSVTYIMYLFATCPGVSKVGSYTGTGTTLQINCGFSGGARFVLIKATSTTGDWLVWDSSRGIVAGNDPYLALNSTAAEVTNTDWVDTYSAGFELSSAAGNLANTNGVSYIYLSVA